MNRKLNTSERPIAEGKREVFTLIKDQPCVDCGGRFPEYVMEFDHARGVKEANPGDLKYGTLERLVSEIQKCDLVCSNCHQARTYHRARALRVRAPVPVYPASDWATVLTIPVSVDLDPTDALAVGQKLLEMARNKRTGTRELFDTVGRHMISSARLALMNARIAQADMAAESARKVGAR